MEGLYVYISWPDSQEYMEEDWFEEEAILDINSSSNYLIPVTRLNTNPIDEILQIFTSRINHLVEDSTAIEQFLKDYITEIKT